MVREFREVLEKGYTGPNGIRRAPDWGKTLVFAVTKRHAETLARLLDQEFADKKPSPTTRYADFVVSGLGPEDTVDGAAKIRRFKKEEFPQILVSVNMLDTGFDCPEVRNLVMARLPTVQSSISRCAGAAPACRRANTASRCSISPALRCAMAMTRRREKAVWSS